MTEPEAKPVFCDLTDHGLIRVAGADARTFLQGQLSNDVHQVTPAQSQLTALNTPQGRTLALMRLFELGDALYLALPAPLRDPIVAHLRRYVLRARVTIDTSDDIAVAGIAGETAATALAAADMPTSDVLSQVAGDADGIAIRVPGTPPRFETFASSKRIAARRDALGERCRQADIDEWRLLDTLAGLPLLGPETSGEFVAQMLNLDELGAINFNKGCYTGQEVIARAHYRGQVKRRAKLIFSNEPAGPGETITSDNGDAATVLQCAPHPQRGFALLAVAPVA